VSKADPMYICQSSCAYLILHILDRLDIETGVHARELLRMLPYYTFAAMQLCNKSQLCYYRGSSVF